MSNDSRRCNDRLWTFVRVLAIGLLLFAGRSFAAFAPPAQLVVVTDDNYPPYLFRAEDGQLQGILKDKWALWSGKTGIPVRVEGMAWAKAQESVLYKKADVIDALVHTDARAPLYEFSPPDAPIDARIYFHNSISGINDVSTVRGFVIGAKEGSACANWLTERGVQSIRPYPSSDDLVRAAGAGEVRLFCMDDPAARYLLFKHKLAAVFRETAPLYSARYHWAVVKERTELRDFIQRGFEQIPAKELDEINARWLGSPVKLPIDSRYLYYFAALAIAAGAIVALLLLWNGALRVGVSAKTAALRNALASVQTHADKIQDLYNNAPCGYHSLDLDGVFVEINDTELKWLGCTRDEVINKLRLADFLDGEGQRKFRREFHEFSETGSARDMEFELVCRDGSRMSVLISSTMVRDRNGNFLMTRSTVYDVTELKRAELALRATLDYTPNVAVQWFDAEGRIKYCNSASTRILGWDSEEVIGRTLDEIGLYTAEQAREFTVTLRSMDRDGKALAPAASSVLCKDGSRAVLLSTLFPIPAPSGEKLYACMSLDVTENRRSEERLLATLENTPGVAVQWFDREGRVLYWNPASEAFYGISPDDAVGRRMDELIHTPEQYHEFLRLLGEIERTGRPSDLSEIVIRSRHGVEKTVIFTLFTIPGQRAEPIFVCMDVDISQLKASEREREQLNTILTRVTEAVPLCLSYLDANHRYVWTNARNVERLGYPPDWIIGRTAREVYGKRYFPEIEAAWPLLREGKTVREEREWRDASGRLRIYERILIPDLMADGTYRGQTSMWLDNTERATAERERERLVVVLKRVTDAVPICLSYLDAENRYVWTNTRNSERLGTVPEQMIGRTVREVHSGLQITMQGGLNMAVREGKPVHDELEWKHPDGKLRDYERFFVPDLDPGGAHRGITSLWLDITERKIAEKKISRLNRVYAMLSNINAASVRIRNKQELFDEACRIAVEHGQFGVVWVGLLDPVTQYVDLVAWSGTDADELREFKSSAYRDALSSTGTMTPAIREKHPVFDNDIASTAPVEGTRRWRAVQLGYRSVIVLPLLVKGVVAGILAMLAKEPDFFTVEEVKLLTELAGDVAFAMEVIEKEQQINYLAHYDPLTDLPNRALLHERLEHQIHIAQQKGDKVSVLVVDVRRFRFINETLGRPAGDVLLREISARLKSVLPVPDNLGRVTGDRFAAVLTDVKSDTELVHLIEKAVMESMKFPFTVGKHELVVAMTAGIAVYPDDGTTADMLFQNAEAAVKQAKMSAVRYLFYQPQMNARMAETLLLENKMRRALAKQEFVLHYQPKINLADGRIIGFEALIRWNDPDSGVVPPVQFIPILEETEMIVEAGLWAMRRVLRDYGAWKNSGLAPPRIAVNVSAIQLRQKDFVDVVLAVMNEVAADFRGMDLEITESLLMEDIEGSIAKLRAIRDMGVKIAIDDFGTGYSSLSYLARLPLDTLKIDRSFVIDMINNPDSMTIVSTVISLAHALNLKVIAEGVESADQMQILRNLQCDEIQGYLVGRPAAAEAVTALLGTRKNAALNTVA